MSQIFLSPFAMPELDRVVEQLCAPSSLEGVFHRPLHDAPMPSLDVLEEILSRLKIALFPGYFGMSNVRMESMRYHLSANLDSIFRKPIIPPNLSEMAHAITGIDIHPGASVGEAFFIDHGTGVVIGETCVIGRGCRLYQGVTLGALSFPKGADGVLIKGIPRHPKLEDDVTVYAGATILGNITIGAGSVIGANTWVTRDVPRNSKVVSGD